MQSSEKGNDVLSKMDINDKIRTKTEKKKETIIINSGQWGQQRRRANGSWHAARAAVRKVEEESSLTRMEIPT